MPDFLTEQEFAIAMAVVSTATMMMGFILGFTLSYIEKELVTQEMHELLDKAIEKKFERDVYVLELEATIDELQRANTKMSTTLEIPAYHPVLKRRRTDIEGTSSDEETLNYPPILKPFMSEETRIELEKNKEMMQAASFPPAPAGPIERCVARGVSDRSEKEPHKED